MLWRFGAPLYVFINLAGAAYAVAMDEPLHATGHVVLLLVGFAAYGIWRRGPQAEQQDLPGAREAAASLDHLQQSVDAIALEVERIGEAQRFEAKLLNERIQKSALNKDQ
jgi:hypothetical protein